ncbi:MAG: hypothetical protein BYD32DRAFT_412526 [Podila humilis]|nr:MAG: hypothetical protein BYD32DRAFT_412526 [Podila humilis]
MLLHVAFCLLPFAINSSTLIVTMPMRIPSRNWQYTKTSVVMIPRGILISQARTVFCSMSMGEGDHWSQQTVDRMMQGWKWLAEFEKNMVGMI